MRMALQSVLTKPALVSKRVLDQLLSDVAGMQSFFTYDDELEKFLESKYFSLFSAGVSESIFKSLWKLVFRVEDGLCEKNREINFRVLRLVAAKEPHLPAKWVAQADDYYSNITSKNEIVKYLIKLLSFNKDLYPLLQDHTKLTIRHCVEKESSATLLAAFLYNTIDEYKMAVEVYVKTLIGNAIDSTVWAAFRSQLDNENWRSEARRITNLYYAESGSFDTADRRFSHAIGPDLSNYTLENLRNLMEVAARNDQCCGRGRAGQDHGAVKARVLVLDPHFDFTQAPFDQFVKYI